MENKLELFAIVELFGHSKLAGKITEQSVGSSTFIRVDVPETKRQPSFSRIVNPSAIYALNPVTKEVMEQMAASIEEAPLEAWDISRMTEKLRLLKEENEQS